MMSAQLLDNIDAVLKTTKVAITYLFLEHLRYYFNNADIRWANFVFIANYVMSELQSRPLGIQATWLNVLLTIIVIAVMSILF